MPLPSIPGSLLVGDITQNVLINAGFHSGNAFASCTIINHGRLACEGCKASIFNIKCAAKDNNPSVTSLVDLGKSQAIW